MPNTITYSAHLATQDQDFIGRIASVLVSEGLVSPPTHPGSRAGEIVPWVVAQPGISDAYHAAILADRADAGTADDVITDGALLAAVVAAVGVAS